MYQLRAIYFLKESFLHTNVTSLLALLLLSFSFTHAVAVSLPDDGLSVSVKSTMDKHGNFNTSGFHYDTNFQLITDGKVGRNGKVGNVKAAKITGVNTSLKGNIGSMTLDNQVQNKPDITHIEKINKNMGNVPQKTISMGTASPHEFKQLPQFKSRYAITGIWMNSSDFCMNCNFSFTTGMFIDGTISPSSDDSFKDKSKDTSTFIGALDGMPKGECEGECEWGLKASLKAVMSHVVFSIKINTTKSFIHYKNTRTGKTRVKPRPDLNISGTLTFDQEKNLFIGKIKDGSGVTGTAMGRYYGPEHDEIAIVYALGKAAPETMQMGVMFGGR